MKILITGAKGQLGQALPPHLPPDDDLTLVDIEEMDITDKTAVFHTVAQTQPDVVLHCAAYTNVDACAKDPALAYRINALGSQNVALACLEYGAEMVHISTNEVFAGDNPAGYEEWMARNPINGYGRSKAAAESLVLQILNRSYIVRTAWLYAPGGRNFIHAILNRAREQGQVRVVVDEIGSPTYVNDLAQAIAQLITTGQYGIYHFTNAGSCSRWEFANEILRQASLNDVVNTPILSREYKRASTPPPYGIIHNIAGAAIGITLRPWQEALANYLSNQ
jgi:dTDP-4-dehydrorhamnose reductase